MLFAATGFAIGRVPWAPGTFGTLLGFPLAWGIVQLPPLWQCLALAAFWVFAVPVCGAGARLLHGKDPGPVVLDEVAAVPLLYLMTPLTFSTAVAGFILFRLFDITKPWPARALEKLPGGLGILADDLAAGAYAALALWCVARWWPLL
jgi:phosphatidylglycerophosphatase A